MEAFERRFGAAARRGLRHDRGRAPDGVQPAAARRAPRRVGRARHRAPRSRSSTTSGGRSRAAPCGEVCVRGPGVVDAYRANPEANGGELPRRLVPHRRLRQLSADGYLLARRPHQGADQPRRREDLAARGRGRAARAIPTSSRRSRSPCRTPSTARPSAPRSWRDGGRRATRCAPTATGAWRRSRCPARIYVVDAIPKGPTGKVQRRLLAEQLPMRVAVLGAGAIGAYVGAALARGGADVAPDRARRAPRGAARARRHACVSPRGDFHAHPPAHGRPGRGRPGRRRLPRAQGVLLRRLRPAAGPAPARATRRSSPRRTASRGGTSTATAGRSTAGASRPSTRRRDERGDPARARDRLRRLLLDRARGARRRAPQRGHAVLARRARSQPLRALPASSPRRSSPAASRRPSSRTCATRSGSSCWATPSSTRSAC